MGCRFYRGSGTTSIRLFSFRGRTIKINIYWRVDYVRLPKPPEQ